MTSSMNVNNDNGNGNLTASTGSDDTSNVGYLLRWSRLHKTVEVKDNSGGFLRSSISAASARHLALSSATLSSSSSLNNKKKSSSSIFSRCFNNNHGSAAKRNSTTTTTGGGNNSTFPTPSSSSNSNKKTILNQVSGCACPGEMLACMGPSGSGKTSLLNTVSGRCSYNSGIISLNGEIITPQSMKFLMSKIAYVKQADIFFNHLSVADQLTYTALLRLPSTTYKSRADKYNEVNRIIKLLRLSKVSNSPIKLLSGGEKKRVNIGTELLTNPSILLLDEPTSGLDSTSAVSLLNLLSSLARDHGKTVITSIHQPSSAVFRSFDKVVMLSEGHVVYFGKPSHSLQYLRNLNLTCPDGYNAADHWMDLLVIDSSIQEQQEEEEQQHEEQHEEEQQQKQLLLQNNDRDSTVTSAITQQQQNETQLMETDSNHSSNSESNSNSNSNHSNDGQFRRRHNNKGSSKNMTQDVTTSTRMKLQLAWDGEAVAEDMDRYLIIEDSTKTTNNTSINNNNANNQQQQKSTVGLQKYNTSWWNQYMILTHRSLKNSRSAIFTPLNLTKSLFIGLITGLIWFQMDYTESRVRDRSAYYFFTMTFWVFDAMFGALTAFPDEIKVILKERASGAYHVSAYFLAKTTSDVPVRLGLPFLYMITSFWMAGIDNSFSVFAASTACTLLSVVAGEALGLLTGACIMDMQKGMTIMLVIMLGLMLLGGFYVENIPYFISWIRFFSPFKYAFDSSLQIVFNHDVPCDGSGALEQLCMNRDYGYAKADDVIKYLRVQGSIGFNVGMLLAICCIPRYLAYLALRSKKGGERS